MGQNLCIGLQPMVSPLLSWNSGGSGAAVFRIELVKLDGSTLTLFVARVFADNHDPAVAANHLAFFANLFDARVDLHFLPLRCRRTRGMPRVVTFRQPVLLIAVDDSSPREVVWAELYDDLVLREDSDVVLAHLA